MTADTDPHGETEHERRDRELEELLQETRVALPGVQVLFAFLLVLPFQARYDRLPVEGRAVYLVTAMVIAWLWLILPLQGPRRRQADQG